MSGRDADVGDAVSRSLVPGIAGGIGAYIASYVVLFLFLLAEGGELLEQQAWKAAGWVFYGAHNVDVTISIMGQSQSQNVLQTAAGNTAIPTIIYYLVPVIVLVAVGYVVATQARIGDDVAAGAAAGATITIGYLILAILGTFLFAIGQGGASASPDLMMSILLAGLAYPIVFGAVGGAIAGATN